MPWILHSARETRHRKTAQHSLSNSFWGIKKKKKNKKRKRKEEVENQCVPQGLCEAVP